MLFPCHASALGTLFSAVLALTLDANPKAASYDYLEHCALDVRLRSPLFWETLPPCHLAGLACHYAFGLLE